MDNAEEDGFVGRVTRSRKRLVSLDSELPSSRPGTPLVPKLTAITESSDGAPQRPARITRRNSITSTLSTPKKTTKSAALRAETPDIIGSPARKSTKKRIVSITEEEHCSTETAIKDKPTNDPSTLATKPIKRSSSKLSLQPSPTSGAPVAEHNENSNSPKSKNHSTKKTKSESKSKSKTKKFDDVNLNSDTVEIVNFDEDEDTASNKNNEIIVIIDDNDKEKQNITATQEDKNGATNKEPVPKNVQEDFKSISEQSLMLTNDSQNNDSSKATIVNDSKHEQINKTVELCAEDSGTIRHDSETHTSPSHTKNVKQLKEALVVITEIRRLNNLTPEEMIELKISPNNSPVNNKKSSANTKSVAFNSSDSENVVKSTFPKTPRFTASQSNLDVEFSNETWADHSYQCDKGAVASFNEPRANSDEEFLMETQEVQQHQCSKVLGHELLDVTSEKEAAVNVCDDNSISQNTPNRTLELLKNVQSSTPLHDDAHTKQLKNHLEDKTTTAEAQDQHQVSLNSAEKSLRSGKRYGESPNVSPKVLKKTMNVEEKSPKNTFEGPKAVVATEFIETAAEATRSKDVPLNSLDAEVVPETQESAFNSPIVKLLPVSENTSQNIDKIVSFDSTTIKSTDNENNEKKNVDELAAKVSSKRHLRYASDDEDNENSVSAENNGIQDTENHVKGLQEFVVEEEKIRYCENNNDGALELASDEEQRELGNSKIAAQDTSFAREVPDEDYVEEAVADNIGVSNTKDPLLLEFSDDDKHLTGANDAEENASDKLKSNRGIPTSGKDSEGEVVEANNCLNKELQHNNDGSYNPLVLDVTRMIDETIQDESINNASAQLVEDKLNNSKEIHSAKAKNKKRKSTVYANEQLNSSSREIEDISVASEFNYKDDVEDADADIGVLDTVEDPLLLKFSDEDDEQLEGGNAVKENSGEKLTKTRFFKRFSTGERDSDAEVVDVNNSFNKENQHNKEESQPLVLEKIMQDKIDKSNDINASISFVEDEVEAVNSKELNSAKKSEKKKKRKSSLLSANTNEQLNSISPLKAINNFNSSIGSTDAIVNASIEHTNPSKSSTSRRSSLRRSNAAVVESNYSDGLQCKSAVIIEQHSKTGEEISEDNASKNKLINIVVEENVLEKSQSKRLSLKQSRADKQRKSSLSENKLQKNCEKELDEVTTERRESTQENVSEISESEVIPNKSLSKEHRKSILNDSQLDCKSKQNESVEKEFDILEETNSMDLKKPKRVSLNQSRKKNKRNSMLNQSEPNISTATESVSEFEANKSLDIFLNVSKESDADNEQHAKDSSKDENQYEKLTPIDKLATKSRRSSLTVPVASRLHEAAAKDSPNTLSTKKSKRNTISASTAEVVNTDVIVFNPSQLFDEPKCEVQTEKHKRHSKTLDNTFNDEGRHSHKKSKIVKDTRDDAKLVVVNRKLKKSSSPRRLQLSTSSSSTEDCDIARILSRCEEILNAENSAKLKAKSNSKKRIKFHKKSCERPSETINDAQEAELKIEKDLPLVLQKDHSKKNSKLAQIKTAPLGVKKNKAMPKFNEDKYAEKCLPPQLLEALSDASHVERPPVPNKKRKLESQYPYEQENLSHGHNLQHHQLKSNTGNTKTVEKKKAKNRTHIAHFEMATGTVAVEPVTPRKITTTQGLKVRQKRPAGQDPPLSSSSSMCSKPKRPIARSLWTQSGVFMEEKLNGAVEHKTDKATVESINARALNFKQMQMFRKDIPRECTRSVLQRKQRANWHD